jgi:hypothetical protein
LKEVTKCVSNRISGVKNLESQTTSLLRAVPFSQVQSAKAKGSVGFGFSGNPERACAASTDVLTDAVSDFGSGVAAVAVPVGAVVGLAAVAPRLFSSALNASISACMAANCLATAGDISGSAGVDAGAVFAAELFVAPLSRPVSAE